MTETWSSGNVRACFTDRNGGISETPFDSRNLGLHVGDDRARVAANRRSVVIECGIDFESMASAVQVHGTTVVDVDSIDAVDRRWDMNPPTIEADALITRTPRRGIVTMVADCVPIVIAAPNAVAVVHAGWRGFVDGIVDSTLDRMPSATAAAIGPCIGPCCFEVGPEVAERFQPEHIRTRSDWRRPHVDMRSAVAAALQARGIEVEHVDTCTSCDRRYFSHRRDGAATGRQCALAWFDAR
jgi:YfiH family protein